MLNNFSITIPFYITSVKLYAGISIKIWVTVVIWLYEPKTDLPTLVGYG